MAPELIGWQRRRIKADVFWDRAYIYIKGCLCLRVLLIIVDTIQFISSTHACSRRASSQIDFPIFHQLLLGSGYKKRSPITLWLVEKEATDGKAAENWNFHADNERNLVKSKAIILRAE